MPLLASSTKDTMHWSELLYPTHMLTLSQIIVELYGMVAFHNYKSCVQKYSSKFFACAG